MVIIIVEHYLNQEGELYFPSWLQEVRNKLKKWPGFIRLKLLESKGKTQCILYLEFSSKEKLNLWAASIEHSEMLTNISKFKIKKYHSTVYEVVT